MNILTLDFETYYDKQFSLSKMTTEEYIRDPQFEVIGVSVQINDGMPEWFSGTMEETGEWLRKFDWANSAAVAHNAMFDLAILNWHFDLRPKRIVDTLSMARAIHGTEVGGSLAALTEHYRLGVKGTEVINALGKRRKDFTPDELEAYGEYCKNDVALTYALFGCLMAEGFAVDELRLIDVTIRMFSEPVLQVDAPLLEAHLISVKEKKEKLLSKALVNKDDLMSNPKFAELLTALGVVPPMKISPTTGKETYAFSKQDEEFMLLLGHPNVLVQSLVSARLGLKSTLEESRTERFINIAKRGSLPIPLKYYAAHTGRWGGDDSVNMQNLPRGSTLKNALMAPPGYVLVDSDSSQIEARTLAWWAGQDDLVGAFERGDDVYKIMAAAIYGKMEADITKDERFVGKTTILGAGYGMGYKKFHMQLKNFGVELPLEECERIITVYRRTYDAIPALWKQAQDALYAMIQDQTAPLGKKGVVYVEGKRGIRLPNGLYIKYPNLRLVENDEGKTEFVYDTKRGRAVIPNRIYGGKVVENCIAEGTLVLTDRGWSPIEAVQSGWLVHDGVEFVAHGGIVFKSIQPCVMVDGVYMTGDHEVLTDEGWKAASQNPKPYRPSIRGVDCPEARTQQRKETELGVPVRLREAVHESGGGCRQGAEARGHAQLRMPHCSVSRAEEYNSRHEPAPSVRRLAQYVRQVRTTYTSSMAQLRGAWDTRMQAVAVFVREFLGGYGPYLSAGARLGAAEQQQRVFPSELCVGIAAAELFEQAKYPARSGRTCAEPANRDIAQHVVLPAEPWVAGVSAHTQAGPDKPVYDILNAGPRHRFVVMGAEGPFIVHNCVQALARIAVGEQLLRIAKKYKVVMTVHDAVCALVPEAEEDRGLEYVELCMRIRPTWAPDLPLNCEAGADPRYGQC